MGGYLETVATNKFLKENLGQRFPLIISRSSFYGTGKWGYHWTGDNSATWEYLRVSIATIF